MLTLDSRIFEMSSEVLGRLHILPAQNQHVRIMQAGIQGILSGVRRTVGEALQVGKLF